MEGKCVVPNAQGKLVRCQLKHCDGCPYRDHKNTFNEDTPGPRNYFADNEYKLLTEEFLSYVQNECPRLTKTAQLRLKGYNLTECSKILGKSVVALHKDNEKLKVLLEKFLQSINKS